MKVKRIFPGKDGMLAMEIKGPPLSKIGLKDAVVFDEDGVKLGAVIGILFERGKAPEITIKRE